MKGDFTRNTFSPQNHYNGVRMQQGRVQTDADWNEQADIEAHLRQTLSADFIGPSGTSTINNGFALSFPPASPTATPPTTLPATAAADIVIQPGHYYVNGLLCELEAPPAGSPALTYLTQPDYPTACPGFVPLNPPPSPSPGYYLAYLDVWERPITAVENPDLRELALGGPDTGTRVRTVWQLKLWSPFTAGTAPATAPVLPAALPVVPSLGQLTATYSPGPGDIALENRLYRVEVQQFHPAVGNNPATVDLKWSRDNGSMLTQWIDQALQNSTIQINCPIQDPVNGFASGQYVELLTDVLELSGIPGPVLQILSSVPGSAPNSLSLNLSNAFPASLPQSTRGMKARRWDGFIPGVPLNGTTLQALEAGIKIQLAPGASGTYQPGDYWLISARSGVGIIDWPADASGKPLPQLPKNTVHQYALIGALAYDGKNYSLVDYRTTYWNLSNMTAQVKTDMANVTALTTQVNTSNANVTALTTQVNQNNANVATLTTQVQTNTTNITNFQTTVNNTVSGLSTQVQQNTTLVQGINSQLQTDTNNIALLMSQLADAREDLAARATLYRTVRLFPGSGTTVTYAPFYPHALVLQNAASSLLVLGSFQEYFQYQPGAANSGFVPDFDYTTAISQINVNTKNTQQPQITVQALAYGWSGCPNGLQVSVTNTNGATVDSVAVEVGITGRLRSVRGLGAYVDPTNSIRVFASTRLGDVRTLSRDANGNWSSWTSCGTPPIGYLIAGAPVPFCISTGAQAFQGAVMATVNGDLAILSADGKGGWTWTTSSAFGWFGTGNSIPLRPTLVGFSPNTATNTNGFVSVFWAPCVPVGLGGNTILALYELLPRTGFVSMNMAAQASLNSQGSPNNNPVTIGSVAIPGPIAITGTWLATAMLNDPGPGAFLQGANHVSMGPVTLSGALSGSGGGLSSLTGPGTLTVNPMQGTASLSVSMTLPSGMNLSASPGTVVASGTSQAVTGVMTTTGLTTLAVNLSGQITGPSDGFVLPSGSVAPSQWGDNVQQVGGWSSTITCPACSPVGISTPEGHAGVFVVAGGLLAEYWRSSPNPTSVAWSPISSTPLQFWRVCSAVYVPGASPGNRGPYVSVLVSLMSRPGIAEYRGTMGTTGAQTAVISNWTLQMTGSSISSILDATADTNWAPNKANPTRCQLIPGCPGSDLTGSLLSAAATGPSSQSTGIIMGAFVVDMYNGSIHEFYAKDPLFNGSITWYWKYRGFLPGGVYAASDPAAVSLGDGTVGCLIAGSNGHVFLIDSNNITDMGRPF